MLSTKPHGNDQFDELTSPQPLKPQTHETQAAPFLPLGTEATLAFSPQNKPNQTPPPFLLDGVEDGGKEKEDSSS
jgi:hypothetical protein